MRTAASKISSVDDLANRLAAERAAGRRIALVGGSFDVLRGDSVRRLADAKAAADVLVVAIDTDEQARSSPGEGRPATRQHDRAIVVAALRCVDHVVCKADPAALLRLAPDVSFREPPGADTLPGPQPPRGTRVKLSGVRVTVGWVLGLLTAVLARPTLQSIALGLALCAAGELLRLWASGHIEKTARLATGGPYAHTRNPLYLGSSLLAVGTAVAAWSPWVVLAVLAYFAAFYPAVIAEESRFLRAKFGPAYDDWAAEVPAFLPRVRPAGPRSSRFDWARVRQNREWRTALALPLLGVLLYLRGLL